MEGEGDHRVEFKKNWYLQISPPTFNFLSSAPINSSIETYLVICSSIKF